MQISVTHKLFSPGDPYRDRRAYVSIGRLQLNTILVPQRFFA